MDSLISSRDSGDQLPPRALQRPSAEQNSTPARSGLPSGQLIHDIRKIENDDRERKPGDSQVDAFTPPLQQSQPTMASAPTPAQK